MTIAIDQVKRSYISIDEAKKRDGLRIILPELALPGPWFESCKSIYHVKGLDFVAVKGSNPNTPGIAIGQDGTQSQLLEWTGQSSLPVVVWNDDLPRSHWTAQLRLAEKLSPEPQLIPSDPEARVSMFGLANELLGENGLAWDYRLTMVIGGTGDESSSDEQKALFAYLGDKYGYNEPIGKKAMARVRTRIELIDVQLKSQKTRGSRFLIGDTLSALDIYWACVCGLLAPMDESRCPMSTDFRQIYGQLDAAAAKALSSDLLDHRDFIYAEFLELPIVF